MNKSPEQQRTTILQATTLPSSRASVETRPDPPQAEAPTGKKQKKGKLLPRLILIGSLLLGGAGVEVGVKTIMGSNNNQPPSAGETISKENIIQLTKSSFTPVSKEQEQELWKNTKTVDLENHTLTMGFPFDQATVDKSSDIRINQEFDTISSPFIDANKLKQEGVKNVTSITGLSKGDKYQLKYDTNKYDASIITIIIAGVKQGEGLDSFTPAYTSLRIILRNKQTGKSDIRQTISGLYAKPLVEIKPLPTGHSSVYEDGIPVQSGNPILELTTDLQDWDGKNQTLPGERGQFTTRSGYMQENPRTVIPLTANFLHISDGNIASTE